jgi:ribosome-associated protein
MTAHAPLRVNSQIAIPRGELRFSFVRSSGPGGQNVNKVASKAVLRWCVAASHAVPAEVQGRILAGNPRRINERGELIVTSQRFRDQAKNVEDCLAKLRAIVAAAAVRPKRRKKTRPPKAARESRLHEKRAIGEKKRGRRPPANE